MTQLFSALLNVSATSHSNVTSKQVPLRPIPSHIGYPDSRRSWMFICQVSVYILTPAEVQLHNVHGTSDLKAIYGAVHLDTATFV